MARWRQTVDPETGESVFIPIDAEAQRRDGHFVHGDIESFVSPIDGSVISDRRQLDEHCRRHGVVPAAEFSREHYAKAAEKRANLYTGDLGTRAEQQKRREAIHEAMTQAERAARRH